MINSIKTGAFGKKMSFKPSIGERNQQLSSQKLASKNMLNLSVEERLVKASQETEAKIEKARRESAINDIQGQTWRPRMSLKS